MEIDNYHFWTSFLEPQSVGKAKNKILVAPKKFNTFNIKAVADEEELVWYVDNPFVVVDVDDIDNALLILKILRKYNYKFIAYFSKSKGMHFIFKSANSYVSKAGKCLLDLKIEIKCWSNNKKVAQIVVKENNQFRKIVNHCETDEISEIPFWLLVQKGVPLLKGLGIGDGRNSALASLWGKCKGLTSCESWLEFERYISVVNNFIFSSPLSELELVSTVLRPENKEEFTKAKDESQITALYGRNQTFKYTEFVNDFLSEYDIRYWNGRLWIYNGEIYTSDKKIFWKRMIELYDKIVKNNREEVYVRLEIKLYNSSISPTKGVIGLKNGLLDYRNEIKFIDFTPDIFCVKKINVEWDDDYLVKNKKHEIPDKVLTLLSSHQEDIKNFILDTVANIFIYWDNRHELLTFFEGTGGNGKSSFFIMIENLFGKWNGTGIPLQNLKDKFILNNLCNAMYNLTAETKPKGWGDVENLKAIVSGDSLTVRGLYENPITVNPCVKMFISANELQTKGDMSDEALMRRLAIIPCDENVTNLTKDVTIKERLVRNEKGISETFLKMILPRLQKILATNKIIKPKVVEVATKKKFQEFETTSLFLFWLKGLEVGNDYETQQRLFLENELSFDYLPDINRVKKFGWYIDYLYFCHNILGGIKPFDKRIFIKQLKKVYHEKYKLVKENVDGKREWIWIENEGDMYG